VLYIKGKVVNETSSVVPSCPIRYYGSRNTSFLVGRNETSMSELQLPVPGLTPPVTSFQMSSLALFSVLVHVCLVSAGTVLASLTGALTSVQLPLHHT